jgi:hypothetical protein
MIMRVIHRLNFASSFASSFASNASIRAFTIAMRASRMDRRRHSSRTPRAPGVGDPRALTVVSYRTFLNAGIRVSSDLIAGC